MQPDYTTTRVARTARVSRCCDLDRTQILPGDRYMRYVTFVGAVQVTVACVTCALECDDEMAVKACLTYCHGTEVCARPADHAGDHRCRRCDHA